MTRVSVHVSRGVEGTAGENSHTIVEAEGRWSATARRAFWFEKEETKHIAGPGGIDGVVTVVNVDGSQRVLEAFLFPAGWRISDAVADLPQGAQRVAKRALRKLPTTT